MNKRTIKFIVIFLTFLSIAFVMPSAVDLPDASIWIPDTPEPEPSPVPTPEPTPSPTPDPTPTPMTPASPQEPQETLPTPEPTPDPIVTITVTAGGDVTLGGCPAGNSYHTYMRVFEEQGSDLTYFFNNVAFIFAESDLNIVNLEGTLTNETSHQGRAFNFRAPPEFAGALSSGGINAVSLANNHSHDYREQGYLDTIESLDAENIVAFGNERNMIIEVNGLNVGLFGFLAYNDTQDIRNRISSSIRALKEKDADLIIAYFHWGREKEYSATPSQRSLGRYTIDSGADLVLGTHPHVINGIEEYNGRNIVYSMGNFSFGGNRTPYDMDAFIFQQTFTFDSGVLQKTNDTNVIPIRTTSVRSYNNYQPTVAEGQDLERILAKLERLNAELNR